MSDPEAPSTPSPLAQAAVGLLEPLIGRMTARKAVELASRAGGDLGSLTEGLRPMLRTLLGGPAADRVLAQLAEREPGEDHS